MNGVFIRWRCGERGDLRKKGEREMIRPKAALRTHPCGDWKPKDTGSGRPGQQGVERSETSWKSGKWEIERLL